MLWDGWAAWPAPLIRLATRVPQAPNLLAWLCGWPLRRPPARRLIKRGRILLLFTDEVSLILSEAETEAEAEAASLFLSVRLRANAAPTCSS